MGNLNKKTSHPKSLKFLEREYIRFNTLNRIYFVFKIPRNLLIVKGFFRKNCELGVVSPLEVLKCVFIDLNNILKSSDPGIREHAGIFHGVFGHNLQVFFFHAKFG